jgi:signal peptidase II
VALPVLIADIATKRMAVAHLQPLSPHPVIGEALRFTLAYNRRGVMGLPVGSHGRWLLVGVTLVVLVALARWLRAMGSQDRLQAVCLALVMGGAAGNLLDRVASDRGVVDFIDVGTSAWRFWTFNVADMAVDVGLALLAWTMWRASKRGRVAGGGESTAG